MNKRFLSAILTAAMICSAVPAAFAAESIEVNDVQITVSTDDKLAAYNLYLNNSANSAVYLADEEIPMSSEEPNSSESPAPSEEPNTSESPAPSEEPNSSESPVPSEEPNSSESPVPSEEPNTSESPAPSDLPEEPKLPESYDSRDNGYVTSVKDQVIDGDCWAFAATSVFETSLLKKGLASDAGTLDLSEKHITDNTYANDENPWSFDYESMGHSGVVASYFSRGSGPVSDTGNGNDVSSYDESKYGINTNLQSEFYVESIEKIPDLILLAVPVTEETSKPENYNRISVFGGYTVTNPADITDEIRNSSYIMENQLGYDLYKVGFYTQQELIKEAILENGSIYTTLSTKAGDTTVDENGKRDFDYFFNNETNAFYNYLFTTTDHAVTIVGWDDNYSKENFVNPPVADGAWIIKNSWGKEQLNEGYMYVSYYDTKICEDIVSFSAASLGDTNKIFQHDEFGSTGTLSFNVGEHTDAKLWALNRFENEKTEQQYLNKVGVYAALPNTTCNIYVSSNENNTNENVGGKNDKNGNGFRDEEPLKTVKFELPGYYVIELDEPVEIWGDFEVAVKYEFENLNNPSILSMAIESAGEKCRKAGAKNVGESYYAIDYGKGYQFKWTDMFDAEKSAGSNACIKAFTTTKASGEKYEVAPLSLTDMSGNVLDALPESGSFLVNTTVTKSKNRLESDYLIIAAYDENGAFASFSYLLLDPSMNTSDSRTLGTMINVPVGKKISTVKAFVWSSLLDNTPISNVSEVKTEAGV